MALSGIDNSSMQTNTLLKNEVSEVQPQEIEEMTCITKLDIVQFKFKWVIENFSFYCHKTGESVESPIFSIDANNSKWILKLYPKGFSKDYNEYISIFIQLKSEHPATLKFNFALKPKDETIRKTSKSVNHMENSMQWGYHKFLKIDFLFDELNGLLFDDTLILVCEGECTVQTSNHQFTIDQSLISNDFSNIFGDEKYSDMTICVSEKEFKVHKVILSARSKVFRKMFEHDMEESQENRVVITDFDEEVISEMLRFIYTGKLQNVEKVGLGLLAVADKYEVDDLKLICEKVLCNKLSIENAYDMFVVADLHSASILKPHILNFMNRKVKCSIMKDQWDSKILENGHLLAEVFLKLIKHEK